MRILGDCFFYRNVRINPSLGMQTFSLSIVALTDPCNKEVEKTTKSFRHERSLRTGISPRLLPLAASCGQPPPIQQL